MALAVAASAGAVLLLSTAFALDPTPSQAELETFRAINDLPSALSLPLVVLGQAGNLLVVPVAVVVAALVRRWRLALALALAGMAAYLLADLAKQLVDRPRPDLFLDGVTLRGPRQEGLGYLSGHAAVSAALAAVTALLAVPPGGAKRHRWLGWALAAVVTVVCVSRVHVGAHLPLDVTGGAALGVLVGQLAAYLAVRALVVQDRPERRRRPKAPAHHPPAAHRSE